MSLSGQHTPLQLNTFASLLQNQGLNINANAVTYMGSSNSVSNYTYGTITTGTVLDKLTKAIRLGYGLIGSGASHISQATYNNLISIGSADIPALGNSVPSSYTGTYTGELTSYGFLRLFSLQAYNEFYLNNGSYSDFLQSFSVCHSYAVQQNNLINSMIASQTFMDGAYSNMNDLTTGDITGVTLATLYWGQDLIASGRSIDLSSIDRFGSPDVLLKTLSKNKAITPAVSLALLSAGLETSQILDIINSKTTPTPDQQKRIYLALHVILGKDLSDVCTILNCQTPNLNTLADLLDPKKLFPNSYTTLTVPVYNTSKVPTNSKTYYLIYTNTGVNKLPGYNFGSYLTGVLPDDIAYACGAFSTSMMQIKHIQSTNIENFSQVVTHLENVSDLTIPNSSKPTGDHVAGAVSIIALGSGPNGTYTMGDFFGAMTDVHYDWMNLQQQIIGLQSTTLITIYNEIYTLLNGSSPYTGLQALIDAANTEIHNISLANAQAAQNLNSLYSQFGDYLLKEQNARSLAISNPSGITSTTNDVSAFIDSLNQYGTQTEDDGTVLILESIADQTNIGGNSLIGAMREIRNATRLGLAGLRLDNDIQTNTLQLPRVPGTTSGESPVSNYTGIINNVPIITGASTTPGSLGGSPATSLVPTNLSIFDTGVKPSVLSPASAVDTTVLCNCDCWDLIK